MDYRKALQVFGFTEHPTEEQLKKTYRKLSVKYHPDVAGDKYEEKFKELVQAHTFLKDCDKTQQADVPPTFFGNNVFTHHSIFTVIRQPIQR